MSGHILGIDEAGRGPVIGPLVICCASCRREDEKLLRKAGAKDSKKLTAQQREEVFSKLRAFCTFRIVEIPAAELNRTMKEMSLNDIEAKAMASMIKNIADGDDCMIDMPDRYSWTFRRRMGRFGAKRFEAEHKADDKYPIVSAASIYAKIMRDRRIEEIKHSTCDFGSGYPSDKKTTDALANPESRKILTPYIRERWKTIDKLKQTKLVSEE